MAEYIDRDKALAKMEEVRYSNDFCVEHTIDASINLGMTKIALSDIPIADVIEREKVIEELKEIMREITRYTSHYSLAKERDAMGQVEWSDYLLKESDMLEIINKKISELEGKEKE